MASQLCHEQRRQLVQPLSHNWGIHLSKYSSQPSSSSHARKTLAARATPCFVLCGVSGAAVPCGSGDGDCSLHVGSDCCSVKDEQLQDPCLIHKLFTEWCHIEGWVSSSYSVDFSSFPFYKGIADGYPVRKGEGFSHDHLSSPLSWCALAPLHSARHGGTVAHGSSTA